MRSVYIVWWCIFAWSICYTAEGYPFLLFANRKDIRIIDVTRPRNNSTIVIGRLYDATALDFHYERGVVFWSDISLEMIKRTRLGPSSSGSSAPNSGGPVGADLSPGGSSSIAVEENVITTDLTSPEGLACDWLADKLYWTDAETNRIEVSQLDGTHRRVLFWEGLDQPRAIALAPMDGLMFWTDWGEIPKIERAAMDGNHSSRVVIVSKNVSWPNGLTVDYETKRIYWTDGKLNFIGSIDYNGEKLRMVTEGDLGHPFALTVFKNVVYWTDWHTRSIHMCNQTSDQCKTLLHGPMSPMAIHAFVSERQPKKWTPCDRNNGGCSHLCLLSPNEAGYTCACPTGVKIKSDRHTCYDGAQEMLLLARRSDLRRISLDTLDRTDVVLQVDGVKHAIAIDYDPVDGYVYWSDDEVRRIQRARLDGSGQEDVVSTEVHHPDGVAVDWIARNIYWTDTGTDRIEVARLNGSSRRVLVNHNLEQPRAIVVDPQHGYMFWTDWGNEPKIERAALDGTQRFLVVNRDLMWPNGLALDYEGRRIYWGDAKTDRIEMSNIDGTNRKVLVSDELQHIFGLSLLGDYIYWTDWQGRSIERVHKVNGNEREFIIEQLPDLMGLKAIRVDVTPGTNPCGGVENGGCSHLCLNRPTGYVCSCPMGLELIGDHRTCIVPKAFLLFTQRSDIRRISLEPRHNDAVIPIGNIDDVISLDFDINDNRIYWTDVEQKTICRAFMNGSHFECVIQYGLEYPECMAIDWVARNVYWTDSGLNRIEVARVDGSWRRALVWEDVGSPRSIAVDPDEGYMYWTDWGGAGSIERAAMDGASRMALLDDVGRVNGLTIDYEERHLYWTNIDSNGIEMADMNGLARRLVVAQATVQLYGLTQYQEYLYWADSKRESIEKANKTTGLNRTRIQDSVTNVMDLLVFHEAGRPGLNPCTINNGGCSHLCLSAPRGYGRLSYNHTCACPTHYDLNADNSSCIAPVTFLLMSQRSQISRLSFNVGQPPDVILPIGGLKSIRRVAYDTLRKHVYWIDGKADVVRRGYENGTSISVVVPNANGQFQPHDLALDVYSQHLFWTCTKNNFINVTRLDGTAVGVVVDAHDEQPRSIVIHPTKRLIFWTNVASPARIERAAMDGSQKVVLIAVDLQEPRALALDEKDDLLFWLDATLGHIESARIDGSNRRVIVKWQPGGQPTSLTVLGRHIYWIDRDNVMRVDRKTIEGGARLEKVPGRYVHLTDVVGVEPFKEHQHSPSKCLDGRNGGCSHLCLADRDVMNGGSSVSSIVRCSCPINLALRDDDHTCGDPPTCGPDHFTCESSGRECIPQVWRCDGTPECDDKSDEWNCENCGKNQFRCRNGECIDNKVVCDGFVHCADGSDEDHCCKRDEFMCTHDRRCIKAHLVCDSKHDCVDGSDEKQPACAAVDAHLRNDVYFTSRKANYTIGIVVVIAVVVIGILVPVVAFCRRRTQPYGINGDEGEECTNMMLATKSMTATVYPIAGMSMTADAGGTSSTTAVNRHHQHHHHQQQQQQQLYDRSHVIGTSSSSSSGATNYPVETLNPPPSPVTDRSQYSTSAYCCVQSRFSPQPAPINISSQKHQHQQQQQPQSYRHYRIRNRPPPPTPCSTDVCDDSEPYHYRSRNELGFESDPDPPPPTPRSHYMSEENYYVCGGGSYPPSPSTERSFFNPNPPPPTPEGPPDS